MPEILMLDALNPPAPEQLVADMRSVNASAVALYVLRRSADGRTLGIGTWTAAHVDAVLADNRHVLPILVPGNAPTSDDPSLAIARAVELHVPKGPMVVDLESESEPSVQWVALFIGTMRSNGWAALRYGDVIVLNGYPSGDGDWDSHGRIIVRAGTIFPIPALPDGIVADQYAVECDINGHAYDASVCDSTIFDASTAPLPPVMSMEDNDEMMMFSPVDDKGQQTGPGILVYGNKYVFVPAAVNDTVDDTRALTNLGVKRAYVSQALFDAITQNT